MNWSQVNFIISYLFIGLILLPLGLFVFVENPKNIINRTSLFYYLSTSWWSFFSVLMIIAKSEYWGTFWDRICLMGVAFIPPTFIHFNYSLLKKIEKDRWFVFSNYFIATIFLFFIFTPLMVVKTAPVSIANYFTVPGPLYLIFVIYFFALSFWGIWCLYKAQLQAKGEYKRQIEYLFWGTLLGYSGGGLNYTLSYGVGIPALVPFGNYAVGLYGLVIAYAITKHELIDIRVVISRGMAYGIAGGLLIVSFIGLNAIKMPAVLAMTSNALLALFWAWGAHRLRDVIQTPLQEKWITGWYDSDKLINLIAKKLIPVRERQEVFKVIAEELKSTIKITNIEIVLDGQKSESRDITPTKKGLVVPFSSSDRLEGVLLLGPKISEDPYNQKDFTLLRTIISQATIVLDRIRPYEEIKENYEKSLKEAERLATINQISVSLSHEINNPLTAILTYVQVLLAGLSTGISLSPDLLKSRLKTIEKETKRIRDLINNLQNIAEPVVKELIPGVKMIDIEESKKKI